MGKGKESFISDSDDSGLEMKRFEMSVVSGSDVDMAQLKKFVETKQDGLVNSLKRIPALGIILGKLKSSDRFLMLY